MALSLLMNFVGSSVEAAPSATCTGSKRALVVQGLLPKRFRGGFENTTLELMKDLTARGYSVEFLREPSWSDVRERMIDNPCLAAFGFVGEGVEDDSATSNVNDREYDLMYLRENEGIFANDVRGWLNGKSLEVVVIHACQQGAQNNRMKWLNAFGFPTKTFKAWAYNVRSYDTYWWQYFWN